MKRLLSILFLMNITPSFANDTNYYIDKIKGNDKNNGKNYNTAWKSINKLNTVVFKPGDKIFLKRGQVFEGSLFLKGAGASGNNIKLGAYGSGKRPIIKSDGHGYSIQLMDATYWEISNIETTGSNMAGIFIGCTKDGLVLNHLRITNCYVHDIGDTTKIDWNLSKSTGGIIVVNGRIDNGGKPVFYNSVFNDVIINNCTVRYNHRWTCLSISSGKINDKHGDANYIKNCTAEYSSADGIRMNGVQNSFIEYCVMYRNGAWPNYPGKNLGGLGAWFFDAENCTIQFCEASHVQAATTDGGAFDIDYWQKNSTIQYCYGHNCSGYGVSVFGADASFSTVNSTVRYNVLMNNGRDSAFAYQGDFFVFTWSGGLLNGVNIHDNISYWNPATNAAALKFDASFTGSNPNSFTNNIIYSDHSLLVSGRNDSLKCDSNIYWANKGEPQWTDGKNKYYTLRDWQAATGQDKHSDYENPLIKYPAWYRYENPAKQSATKIVHIIQPDSNASFFVLNTVNKQKTTISDYKGKPILLSFINSDNSSKNNDLSISQLAFIKSMKRQYEERGLKIIIIDAATTSGNKEKNEQLKNFISDNELEDIVILKDKDAKNITAAYHVTIFPTTFLLSKNRKINHSWENLALPAQLALSIEKLITDKYLPDKLQQTKNPK